jgi:hypothetical protein
MTEPFLCLRQHENSPLPLKHADAHEAMLKPELLPGIGKVKGYKGICNPCEKNSSPFAGSTQPTTTTESTSARAQE